MSQVYFPRFVCRSPRPYLDLPGISKRKPQDNLWGWLLRFTGAVVADNHVCLISPIVTGVCQLVNKMEENTGKIKPFNQNDEQFLEAFVIFCGLGIQNTQMYEAVERAMAKQMVTLEVGPS